MVVQDTESINIELVMELSEIDTLIWNQSNVSSNIIISDVESILKNKSLAEDDKFEKAREKDDILKEYVEEKFVKFDEDDDIDDGGDIQDIRSDDE